MVALGSCCFKYKRKAEHLYHSRSRRTHHQQVSSERPNVQHSRDDESTYDLIDEDNMIHDHTFIRSATSHEHVDQAATIHSETVDQDVSSNSYSEGNVEDPSNEDYLNPYQAMIEVDLHSYQKLTNETGNQFEEILPENPESSVCSAFQACANIHPYQSIISCVDSHNYTPMDEVMPKLTSNGQSMLDFNTEKDGSRTGKAEQMFMQMKRIPQLAIESDDVTNQTEKDSIEVEGNLFIDDAKNDQSSGSCISCPKNEICDITV